MAITYNAGTDTITVTGYTEGTPCNFTNIFNADVAGGWGQVTRQCTNQFCINCKLQIGDGSTVTWLVDTKKQIIFPNGSVANGQINILLKVNSHFRLGTLHDDSRKETSDGCGIYEYNAVGNVFVIKAEASVVVCELYQCSFVGDGGRKLVDLYPGCTTNASKVYNCNFGNGFEFSPLTASCYNVLLTNADFAWARANGAIDKCSINKIGVCAIYTHQTGEYSSTFNNIALRNTNRVFIAFNNTTLNQYLVNPDVDVWHFWWDPVTTVKVYRQYEFDLKVQDKEENAINGATVKIWDLNDNLVVDTTTNASGVITTQTLNYGYYHKVGGDTPVMQTPHTIEISKPGYETYKKKFTVDEKITWRIRLLQAKPVQFLDGNPLLPLCPESQEDDRIVFVPVGEMI